MIVDFRRFRYWILNTKYEKFPWRHFARLTCELLQTLRDRLDRELNPPECYDPLTVLPTEIMHMILAYVEFHELM
jgi:hypothetical protein